jgi:hypothetical protein
MTAVMHSRIADIALYLRGSKQIAWGVNLLQLLTEAGQISKWGNVGYILILI